MVELGQDPELDRSRVNPENCDLRLKTSIAHVSQLNAVVSASFDPDNDKVSLIIRQLQPWGVSDQLVDEILNKYQDTFWEFFVVNHQLDEEPRIIPDEQTLAEVSEIWEKLKADSQHNQEPNSPITQNDGVGRSQIKPFIYLEDANEELNYYWLGEAIHYMILQGGPDWKDYFDGETTAFPTDAIDQISAKLGSNERNNSDKSRFALLSTSLPASDQTEPLSQGEVESVVKWIPVVDKRLNDLPMVEVDFYEGKVSLSYEDKMKDVSIDSQSYSELTDEQLQVLNLFAKLGYLDGRMNEILTSKSERLALTKLFSGINKAVQGVLFYEGHKVRYPRKKMITKLARARNALGLLCFDCAYGNKQKTTPTIYSGRGVIIADYLQRKGDYTDTDNPVVIDLMGHVSSELPFNKPATQKDREGNGKVLLFQNHGSEPATAVIEVDDDIVEMYLKLNEADHPHLIDGEQFNNFKKLCELFYRYGLDIKLGTGVYQETGDNSYKVVLPEVDWTSQAPQFTIRQRVQDEELYRQLHDNIAA